MTGVQTCALPIFRTERGRGTFIDTRAEAVDPARQRERLRAAVRRLLSQAHLSGVELSDVLDLLHEVHAALESERARRLGGEPPDQEVPS